MTRNEKEMMSSIFAKIAELDYIKPDEIPNIDLYMDQVTTFMEENLASTKRHEDDKILTKTMINNYAKNKLLPPPEKKRYSREHLLMLIFIYYFKSILSISDIQSILNPITDKYFGKGSSEMSLEDIYKEVFGLEHQETLNIMKDLAKKFNTSMKTFEGMEGEDAELLRTFSFICMLSYDVYLKKTIIEHCRSDAARRKRSFQKRKIKPGAEWNTVYTRHDPCSSGFFFLLRFYASFVSDAAILANTMSYPSFP